MISLADVRDWLSGLDAIDATWSIGRIESEKEQRAGVYQRESYGTAQVALGKCTKTYVKSVSVLIHWNKNHRETEEAAQALYDALSLNPPATIGDDTASYIDLQLPEPVDMGSDDHGIFERVIWLDIYYEEA
jgi:hypothetical protein